MMTGFHWIGHLPNGQFAVLYSDPILKRVHTELSRQPSHIEAIRWCRKNDIRLASVARAEGVGRPLEAPNGECELGPTQAKLYFTMLALADSKGFVSTTMTALAKATSTKEGTMFYSMQSLYAKGYVTRTEAGYGNRPSTFQVKKLDDPSVAPAAIKAQKNGHSPKRAAKAGDR